MPGPEPAPAGGRLDDDDDDAEELFASVSSRGSQSDSLPDLMLVKHCFYSNLVSVVVVAPVRQDTAASLATRPDTQHPTQ